MTWVSPRVNNADPCTRGNKPASESIVRTSSNLRPSIRTPSALAFANIRLHIKSLSADLIADFSSGYCSSISSTTSFDKLDVAADWSCLPKLPLYISSILSEYKLSIVSCSPSGGGTILSYIFSFPATLANSSNPSHWILIASCPKLTASIINDSGKKSAAPSIISTASFVPATCKFNLECFICSNVGFNTNWSSIYPTIAPATGLRSGTSLNHNAAALAVIANGSHVLLPS